MSSEARRVLVIGLDCAEPSLVLEQWRQDLPNLNRLMSEDVITQHLAALGYVE